MRRRAVMERLGFRPEGELWHLPAGRSDGDWQPIRCGGGIVFPGGERTVDTTEVTMCRDCLTAPTKRALRA